MHVGTVLLNQRSFAATLFGTRTLAEELGVDDLTLNAVARALSRLHESDNRTAEDKWRTIDEGGGAPLAAPQLMAPLVTALLGCSLDVSAVGTVPHRPALPGWMVLRAHSSRGVTTTLPCCQLSGITVAAL